MKARARAGARVDRARPRPSVRLPRRRVGRRDANAGPRERVSASPGVPSAPRPGGVGLGLPGRYSTLQKAIRPRRRAKCHARRIRRAPLPSGYNLSPAADAPSTRVRRLRVRQASAPGARAAHNRICRVRASPFDPFRVCPGPCWTDPTRELADRMQGKDLLGTFLARRLRAGHGPRCLSLSLVWTAPGAASTMES